MTTIIGFIIISPYVLLDNTGSKNLIVSIKIKLLLKFRVFG